MIEHGRTTPTKAPDGPGTAAPERPVGAPVGGASSSLPQVEASAPPVDSLEPFVAARANFDATEARLADDRARALAAVAGTPDAVQVRMAEEASRAIVGLSDPFPTPSSIPGIGDPSIKPRYAKVLQDQAALAKNLHDRAITRNDSIAHSLACKALHALADTLGTIGRWDDSEGIRGVAILHAQWINDQTPTN